MHFLRHAVVVASIFCFCFCLQALAKPGSEPFPLGVWTAPGLKETVRLTIRKDENQRLTLSIGEPGGRPACRGEEREQGMLLFSCPDDRNIALVGITDSAMFYFDGWNTQMLLVRDGLQTETAPPSGAWKEGNRFQDDGLVLDFEKKTYRNGQKDVVFQTAPAADQTGFPGLTTLSGADGAAFLECVRMGDDILACRSPGKEPERDNPFIGFAPMGKQTAPR